MRKRKSIDDIFKHGLKDPVDEAVFRESDWDSLEKMLDKTKGGGRVFWLPILSSVAALLLAFFGWWMFRPPAVNTAHSTQQVAANAPAKIKAANKQQAQQQAVVNEGPENTGPEISKPVNTAKDEKTFTRRAKGQSTYLAGNINKGKRNPATPASLNVLKYVGKTPLVVAGTQNIPDTTRTYNTLAAVSIAPVITPTDDLSASVEELPKTGINTVAIASKPAIIKTGAGAFRPQFALSAFAASEVNGVGSFQSTSAGTNVGLMFSVGVKKFTLSTGANYSVKPYTLPFNQYHTNYKFKDAPWSVSADCRLLDIPINIGYQLYNKSRNKITIGTGLSSYIMMHESYTYDYGNTSTVYGPSYYAVKNRGKYLFSIMNLQASYERQINSKVGISLQPYLKLPLSDIGYSQVKVQTFGVAVGLNWNINSLVKPK